MGYIIGLALIIFALYLIWLFITKILLPILGVIAVASAVIGGIAALIFSIVNYIYSVVKNINPYTTYVDTSPKNVAGTRRSYFFGPGYHQIGNIIKGAWANNAATIGSVLGWVQGLALPWYIAIWPWIFFIVFSVVMGIAGSLWTLFLSIIHVAVVFAFMCFFYVLFTLLWLADRLVLAAHSIVSRCPQCKEHSVIPVFECPNCGTKHKHLVPGPYGIFTRTCSCGQKLPCTFLNGRSKLASYCPNPQCGSELASSSSSQFGLQLVGGSSSGKTVFLTSFLHQYRQKLNSLGVGYKLHPQTAFNELEGWYMRGKSEATREMNAKMYSIVHSRPNSNISHQLALYDIAGEVFENQSADTQQQQYGYCGGVILMIDPLCMPDVRRAYAAAHEGRGPLNYSQSDIDEVITGFIDDFARLKFIKPGQISDIPLSVVITKNDVDVVNQAINREKARDALMKSNGALNEVTALDKVCREYLRNIGMTGVINNLEAQFRNIHYFPVSAMGHDAGTDTAYQPSSEVWTSVIWIIKERDPLLSGILGLK
jgi:hypothetical protein